MNDKSCKSEWHAQPCIMKAALCSKPFRIWRDRQILCLQRCPKEQDLGRKIRDATARKEGAHNYSSSISRIATMLSKCLHLAPSVRFSASKAEMGAAIAPTEGGQTAHVGFYEIISFHLKRMLAYQLTARRFSFFSGSQRSQRKSKRSRPSGIP